MPHRAIKSNGGLALSVFQKFEQYRTMGGKNKVVATLQHLLSKSPHLLAFLTNNDRKKQRKKEYTRNKRRKKCEKAKNLRRQQSAATAAGEGDNTSSSSILALPGESQDEVSKTASEAQGEITKTDSHLLPPGWEQTDDKLGSTKTTTWQLPSIPAKPPNA